MDMAIEGKIDRSYMNLKLCKKVHRHSEECKNEYIEKLPLFQNIVNGNPMAAKVICGLMKENELRSVHETFFSQTE